MSLFFSLFLTLNSGKTATKIKARDKHRQVYPSFLTKVLTSFLGRYPAGACVNLCKDVCVCKQPQNNTKTNEYECI